MEFKKTNPIELKIKAKTLAAEAVFIKDAEHRAGVSPFLGKIRRTLAAYALEFNHPKPQKPLPDGITAGVGDRVVREIIKRYIASLTPEQYERFKRRREAAFNQRHLLREHRIKVVRIEARATHLARAFLKGMPYSDVEQKAYQFPMPPESFIRKSIEAMVLKYGSGDRRISQQNLEQWFQAGRAYYDQYWKIVNSVRDEAILSGTVEAIQ